jgi:hypothetical protein
VGTSGHRRILKEGRRVFKRRGRHRDLGPPPTPASLDPALTSPDLTPRGWRRTRPGRTGSWGRRRRPPDLGDLGQLPDLGDMGLSPDLEGGPVVDLEGGAPLTPTPGRRQ